MGQVPSPPPPRPATEGERLRRAVVASRSIEFDAARHRRTAARRSRWWQVASGLQFLVGLLCLSGGWPYWLVCALFFSNAYMNAKAAARNRAIAAGHTCTFPLCDCALHDIDAGMRCPNQ